MPKEAKAPSLVQGRSMAEFKELILKYAGPHNGVDTLPNNRAEVDALLQQLLAAKGPETKSLERLPLAGTKWKLVYTNVQTTSGGKFGPYNVGPLSVGPLFGSVEQVFDRDGKRYSNVCSFGPLEIFVDGVYGPTGQESENEVRVKFLSINLKLLGLKVLSNEFKEEQGKGGVWHCAYGSMDDGIRVLYSDQDHVFVLFRTAG